MLPKDLASGSRLRGKQAAITSDARAGGIGEIWCSHAVRGFGVRIRKIRGQGLALVQRGCCMGRAMQGLSAASRSCFGLPQRSRYEHDPDLPMIVVRPSLRFARARLLSGDAGANRGVLTPRFVATRSFHAPKSVLRRLRNLPTPKLADNRVRNAVRRIRTTSKRKGARRHAAHGEGS